MSDQQPVEAEIVAAEVGPLDPASLGLDLPEDREQAIGLLLNKLAEARDEATTYLDDLRRVAADFDNYRKRAIREQAFTVDRAAERVVRQLMPVLDSFDAALGVEAGTDSERQLLAGLIGTREQLLEALRREGLEVIATIGEEFDPEVHEPVSAPNGEGRLVVTEEVRRGYRLRGKVLRAALVVVEGT